MALFDFLWRKPTPPAPQAAATLANPGWMTTWSNQGIPLFGSGVSEETALAIASVFRCVTLISGVVASLDLGVYTDDSSRGRVLVPNSKLTPLFQVAPFPGRQMTSFIWKEVMVMNLLLWGNAYSAIRRDQAGRVAAFEHVAPWTVRISQTAGVNSYAVRWRDGRDEETIAQSDMLHVPGPGFDGMIGMSRIRQNARNSVAMARSIEETLGRAFDNAMAPRTITKLPQGMSADDIRKFRAFMDQEWSGASNSGKNLILDAGAEFDALTINVVDLALIEASKANTTQICMYFGVPPLLLGIDQTTSWGSGIEQLLIAFLRFSLNSDLERFENEFTNKVCGAGQYALFDRDQLLMMDAQTAADVAAKEVASGISTINEARQRRHRPTVKDGDTVLTNSTNIPLSQAIQPKAPPPQPPPPASPAKPEQGDQTP